MKYPQHRGRSSLPGFFTRTLAAEASAHQASVQEVMAFIEREHLFGLGCGPVDLLLLASTLLTPGLALWTLDNRLSALTQRFGVMHQPAVR